MRPKIGSLILAIALAPLLTTPSWGDSPVDRIAGTWRGTSICVNREVAPACTDETVVYEIAPAPGKPDSATIKADKIVDGRRLPMGVLEFKYDEERSTWTTEIETPRVHALWSLTVGGATMTGTMIDLPTKAQVRKMDLRRDK